MPQSHSVYIQQTVQWIQSFVIHLNLCPFAKREMDKGSARFNVCSTELVKPGLDFFMTEIEHLSQTPDIETTLLIFPFFLKDFFEFLDFVKRAQSMLHKKGYEGVYQLATFHPDYCFADTQTDDVTNYTNRSPFPTLHILREESVERAIAAYGDTEKIPKNNMACLRNLGLERVKQLTQLIQKNNE